MIIPGFLISIVTFPGVIVHEIAHQDELKKAKEEDGKDDDADKDAVDEVQP